MIHLMSHIFSNIKLIAVCSIFIKSVCLCFDNNVSSSSKTAFLDLLKPLRKIEFLTVGAKYSVLGTVYFFQKVFPLTLFRFNIIIHKLELKMFSYY